MIGEPSRSERRFAALAACPGCGRSAIRSDANARSVPSRASTLVAAATSATVSRDPQVGQGQHQHAEHAVGAVDQRQALLGTQGERGDPGLAQGVDGRTTGAGAVQHLTLTAGGQGDGRQWCQVTGAAQRAELMDDRGDPGVEHRGIGERGLGSDAGASGGQGAQPQQHQCADHLDLDRQRRRRPRGSEPGCAATVPGRRRAMCRVARAPNPVESPYTGRSDAASFSTTAREARHGVQGLVGQRQPRPVPGHGHHRLGTEPARPDLDRRHGSKGTTSRPGARHPQNGRK